MVDGYTIPELVEGLFDKNDKAAYKCLQELEKTSLLKNSVYQFLDTFVSYVLTRLSGRHILRIKSTWWHNSELMSANKTRFIFE